MAVNAVRIADGWFSPLSKKDKTCRLIEKVMAERSTEERIRAITELGTSGDYGAVGSLIDCCRDQDPEIRHRAIVGLQNLKAAGQLVSLSTSSGVRMNCPKQGSVQQQLLQRSGVTVQCRN